MGKVYQFTVTELRFLEKQPVPLAVYQFVDRHVHTLALSEGFLRFFGYTDKAEAYRISNQNALNNTHPDDVGRVGDAVRRFAVDGDRYEVIFRAKMYQGKEENNRIVHAVGEHVYTDTGVRLAYVWYTDEGEYTDDDTQIDTLNKVFNHALHEESFLKANYYDDLTGLPNMTHFFSLAEEGKAALKAKGGQSVILYMDLDGMKSYNDNYGFAEGDKLLKAFAQILDKTFGNENCCHISADRFAVYTEEEGLEDVLNGLFAEAARLNGGKSLPVRVGIYPNSIGEVPASTACDRAKMACDSIPKTDTSGFRVYSKRMRNELKKRHYILSHIDRAISEKWIQVYYQPIVRAVSEKVCNEEALARWIDPAEGFLSPADFIPILENAGMIYKLDLFVVEQVLEKIKTLEKAGLYIVPQSVNLSRSDFDACDMVEEIRRRVDDAGVSRDRLTIEITESIIGSDFEFIRTQVERFRSLGFPVWMDDFGSGYSSLDVLQSIQFDLIKFDMSFMRKLEESVRGKIILTELMKMATSLGVDTICEGVETEQQVRFLQTIGCSKLQGFYYLKPVALNDVLERYEKGIQIGFEDPRETGYYDAMGRINLYDLSFMAIVDDDVLRNTFDTIPMAVIEVGESGDSIRFVRRNQSFRDFMRRTNGFDPDDNNAKYDAPMTGNGSGFMKLIGEFRMGRDRIFIDEQLEDGSVVHSFARLIYTNPVTGRIAVAVAILSVDRPQNDPFFIEHSGSLQKIEQAGKDAGTTQKIVELQESVSSLLDNMPGMYFTKDAGTGIYMSCNQAFADYAHKETPEGVTGLTDYEIFDPETAAHFVEDDKKALSMDTPYVFFEDVPDAAGNQKQFQTTKMKFIDSTGRQCLLGMCQDVTEAFRIRQERDSTKKAYEEAMDSSAVYARLQAITGNFICVYVVDPENGRYHEFSAAEDYEKSFSLPKEGEDFFAVLWDAVNTYIHPDDRDRVISRFTEKNVEEEIVQSGKFTLVCRIMKDDRPFYVQMNVTKVDEKDGTRLIIGLNDVDEQVRQKERDEEMARRDELTHTKNKTAYHEMEDELQRQIEEGNASFGMVVCDINGLKHVNDTQGHKAGDDYIRSCCGLVCQVFQHSPVFRIGGDEFVAVLRGSDYENRENLISGLRRRVEENVSIGEGPVIASGLAVYQPGTDHNVQDVFNRADGLMYKEKTHLKEQERIRDSHLLKEKAEIKAIPDDRRARLDMLFQAFDIVTEGVYVFLCDIKYDFSRWSKSAVDAFGLPSEYMYGAGDIWENYIHPEDRSIYHKGIDEIFAGNAAGHEMQYRARLATGEYIVCTCRGIVIRDPSGEPEYFAGIIRDHSISDPAGVI